MISFPNSAAHAGEDGSSSARFGERFLSLEGKEMFGNG